jgi:hypothetical protein
MFCSTASRIHRAAKLCVVAIATTLLGGCAVVMVAGAAASVAVTGVGLAADAAVGAVRLTGKAVGATVDVVLPGGGS